MAVNRGRKKVLTLFAVHTGIQVEPMVSLIELAEWLRQPHDPTRNYDPETLETVADYLMNSGLDFLAETEEQ